MVNDQTGNLIERPVRSDERIQSVHIRKLSRGWQGKVHALRIGTLHDTGDCLVFTDADVHFVPRQMIPNVVKMYRI